MSRRPNSARQFAQWRSGFTAQARANDCAEFGRQLAYLGMDFAPEAMLEGTVLLLSAVIAYRELDGNAFQTFLNRQRYWLSGEGLPHYCLTFDLCGRGVGRVLTDEKFSEIDFADLHDHPWHPYQVAGYRKVWISRLDGQAIDSEELDAMDQRIHDDIYFDNSESEIALDVSLMYLKDSALFSIYDIPP